MKKEPRTVKAHTNVSADLGRVAFERGPIVYCAEWPDNDFDVLNVLVNQNPNIEVVNRPDVLNGIVELVTDAQTLKFDDAGNLVAEKVRLTMIPYYAWCHRGPGNMAVWLSQDLMSTRPTPAATLTSKSKVSASHMTPALSAINDRLVPKDGNDRSVTHYQWWPKKGTTEWVEYEFPEATTISNSSVFWYDDGPWGGCRVPKAWKLLYRDENKHWIEVEEADKYGIVKGNMNTVNFKPVKTVALKIEVELPDENSSGIYEWEVR